MPVDTQHPDYTPMVDKWQACRDASAGQEAIHKQEGRYLPRLTEQNDPDYQAYLNRTPFYNATWRTIDGLRGMIFRKPPIISVPPSIEPMLQNIDMSGTPFHMFALDIVEESLTVGRVGIYTDYPEVAIGLTTLADAKTQNFRPALKIYKAEEIINWKTTNIGNANILSMVVLSETKKVPKDEFEDNYVPQWRVLDLFNEDTNGLIYRVRTFEKDIKGDDILTGTWYPIVNGSYLKEIPFQFISVDDVSSEMDNPPLMDLVDMNLSHYKTTADYEHGCHFTGLPTPVISGYMPENNDSKLSIGSTSAWVFPNPQAKASYLEFTGTGLKALSDNLTKKENYMAVLGARMLEAQTKAVEAADTATIHRTGEQSMLASIAQAVSIGLSISLRFFCQFANANAEDVKVVLNRDFFPAPIDSLKLTAIVAAWQNSAISYDTMFTNLQLGEVVDIDRTADEEQAMIKANPPPLPMAGTTPGSPSPNNPTQTQLQHKP